MKNKWLSRKLLATFAAVIVTLLVNQFGLPPETAKEIVDAVMVIVSSYVLGQSAVDTASMLKKRVK